MKFEYMHPADQLVAMMNRIYYKGLTTTSGGNLSVKDAEGNIWITPSGIDKGRLTREDIVMVRLDGEIVGKHRPSIELPFHRAVMEVTGRNAVMHAHPPALVSVSLLRKCPDIDTLPVYSKFVKKLGNSAYDLPGSLKLGEKIAKVFAAGYDAVMMENHGIVVSADTLPEAFKKFENMESAGRVTLESATIGTARHITERQIAAFDNAVKFSFVAQEGHTVVTPLETDIRNEMVAFSVRSARQDLFNSFAGVYAVRLRGNDFLVMPDSVDREYLEPSDIVKIENGTAEQGKVPSVYSEIIAKVLENKPNVGAVSVSCPSNAMAFGVTGAELDSRTIPESYLMMRTVYRMSLDEFCANPMRVADVLDESCPCVLVNNGVLFTAGVNLTKCFDSLEVCDFTAKTLIFAERMKGLGKTVSITQEEVEEINEAFHLN